jgi:hypothetical protein
MILLLMQKIDDAFDRIKENERSLYDLNPEVQANRIKASNQNRQSISFDDAEVVDDDKDTSKQQQKKEPGKNIENHSGMDEAAAEFQREEYERQQREADQKSNDAEQGNGGGQRKVNF